MSSSQLFDPRSIISVNENPEQRPGFDRCLRSVVVAGPDVPGDRWAYLSVKLLTECLAIARASATRRARIARVGVRIDLYQRKNGTTYEVWTLVGADPKPEPLPTFLTGSPE